MGPQEVSEHALSLPAAVEDHPFGPDLDVYKVEGKIFALLSTRDRTAAVSLKCEPELALHLRHEHPAITPGYHLNKRHWNTIVLDGTVPDDEVRDLIDHSYERVVAGLPKAVRLRLG
ncbi:MmcQ/YjbR family DNA-binding protein [Amycolatopsis sp. 195334CR]|uniref:MmcQ/YjbR family DNA-binding protein n=1 Tax=Amycolatopsis sp. 195334CR TaxID=2814588 RepID=UPI001A8C1207|nr:MmcQ/YjbR family DNA-binding protein [Amycolatopsis sp. 195334CR]MBN6039484.1 MmcQ/YjbR family DNA-binding protein [Amycolatopsis sp. 195334CR]